MFEPDFSPDPVQNWRNREASVLEWIKSFVWVLREEVRFGVQELVGPRAASLYGIE